MTSIVPTETPWRTAVERTAVSAGTDDALALTTDESPEGGFQPFGEDGLTFFDLIDIVNPLHHIPLVGTMYRELTGDTLDPASRVAGSTLYFGPIGAAVAVANVVIEETTGKDMGEHMVAYFTDDDAPVTKTAQAEVEDDALTLGITSRTPNAAGTDAEDPVTAWARAELAYRSELAQRQGGRPSQPSRAMAFDPVSAWAAETLQSTAAAGRQNSAAATASNPAPAAPATAPLEAFSDNPSGDEILAEADRRIARALAVRKQRLETAAAAYRANPGSLFASDEPARNPASVPGAAAVEGGWFTEAMLSGLTGYQISPDGRTDSAPKHVNIVN